MELHFKIIGSFLVILALAHSFFPRYFKWTEELSSLSIMNRQMMYVHSFFIAFMVFLMGLLCLTCSAELFTSVLGKRISLFLGIFWMLRLFVQFFGYSSKIWKGKSFETAIHFLFAFFWVYITSVFLWAYFV